MPHSPRSGYRNAAIIFSNLTSYHSSFIQLFRRPENNDVRREGVINARRRTAKRSTVIGHYTLEMTKSLL